MKKAQIKVISKWILILFILIVLIFIYRNFISNQSETINNQICSVDHDYDNDGIKDFMDPCPCDADVKSDCPTPSSECQRLIREKCRSEG